MIYTFYSYKGGVGRTMALANIAELFYKRGLRVLMVDWDLEAPGLDKFFPLGDNANRHPGILDLINNYKYVLGENLVYESTIDEHDISSNEENDEFQENIVKYKRDDRNKLKYKINKIEKSMIRCISEKRISVNDAHKKMLMFDDISKDFIKMEDVLIDIYPKSQGKGKLYLLTAGNHSGNKFSNYAKEVVNFDWVDFQDKWLGDHYLEWLRRQFNDLADIVLIDSRTGISETTGICTYQFADVIVMLCATNEQSIEGTYGMLNNFRAPSVGLSRPNRPLEIIVIPSRVDDKGEPFIDHFHDKFLENFSSCTPKLFGEDREFLWKLRIPYVPWYSFKEDVAVREAEKAHSASIAESFQRLADALIQFSPYPELFKTDPIDAISRSLARNLMQLPSNTVSTLLSLLVEHDTRIINLSEHDDINISCLGLLEENDLLNIRGDNILLKPKLLHLREPGVLRKTISLLGGSRKLDSDSEKLYRSYLARLSIPEEEFKNLFSIQKDNENVILLKPPNSKKVKENLIAAAKSIGISIDPHELENDKIIIGEVLSRERSLEKAIHIYKEIRKSRPTADIIEYAKDEIDKEIILKDFYLTVIQHCVLQALFDRDFEEALNYLKIYLKNGGNKLWYRSRIALIILLKGKENIARTILIVALRESVKSKDRKMEALSVYYLGIVSRVENNLDEARECYIKSLSIFKDIQDVYHEGVVLASMGIINRLENKIEEAIENYSRALRIFSVLGEDFRMACAMARLGTAFRIKGQSEAALDFYNKSLNIFIRYSDHAHISSVYKELGTTYFINGMLDMAELPFIRAKETLRKLRHYTVHDWRREGQINYALGLAYLLKNQNKKSIIEYNEALIAFKSIEDIYNISITQISLGIAHEIQYSHREALRHYQEAVSGLNEINNHLLDGWLFEKIANSYSLLYEYLNSIEFYELSLKEYKLLNLNEPENRKKLGLILLEIGSVYRKQLKLEESIRYLEDALCIFQEMKDGYNISWVLEELGQVYGTQNQFEKAIKKYKDSIDILYSEKKGRKIMPDYGMKELLDVLVLQGKYKLASAKYQEVLIEIQTKSDIRLEGKILRNLGYAYMQMGEKEKAKKYFSESIYLFIDTKDKENLGKTLCYLGLLYKDEKHYLKAIKHIKASINIFRRIKIGFRENWALEILGNVYLSLEKWSDAEEIFIRAVDLDKNSGISHLSLALCYKNIPGKENQYIFERDIAANLLTTEGVSDYDLACLEAVRENFEKSFIYLEKALIHDEAIRKLVQVDPHLRDLRRFHRYGQLVLKYVPLEQIEIVSWA